MGIISMPVCIHTICFKEWGRECAMHFRPRCVCGLFTRFVWVDYTWMVGFVGVGLRGKILRGLVGAVPMCPPVSPHKGASIVKFPAHHACVFGMETPLRGRLGGHTGAAPTVSFGQIAHGRLMPFWGLRIGG
ncbi:hypothetical protein SAMN02745202_01093 [Segatella oulorum]|uniref:Uncharacterized protein n=1 Tax=Segatella oulorum TaxID=28136 RepID=A0A1T4NJ57_9BACT|nr:hypothetical protein SAMN02745202_01093 [Segatella oulorum]